MSPDYDMIIMGTTGSSDVLDELFGSVSSHVARKAECPVLLIPKGLAYKPVGHILYASNYESADRHMIQALTDFNKLFNATLHFVHVRDEEDESERKPKDEIFNELFLKGDPGFGFEFEDIEGEDISEALNEYAVKNGIDLVVMVARKRSFWNIKNQKIHPTFLWQKPTFPFAYPLASEPNEDGDIVLTYPPNTTSILQLPLSVKQCQKEGLPFLAESRQTKSARRAECAKIQIQSW
jgi:nucleotide-binding universal stress UspA family protein